MGRPKGHVRLLAWMAAAIAACCMLPAGASAGTIDFGGSTIDFGATEPGVTKTQTLTLSNPGVGPVTLTSFSLNGANVANFNYSLSDCLQSGVVVIDAGESCEVPIGFIPGNTGTRTAFFRFQSDDPAHPNVSITLIGIGNWQAIFSLDRDVFYPSIALGTSRTEVTSIANNALVPLDIKTIDVVGRDKAEFTVGAVCPAQLPVASECDISVQFKPVASGPKGAAVRISYGRRGQTIEIPIVARATGGGAAGVDNEPLRVVATHYKPKKLKKIKNLSFKATCENANCDAKIKGTFLTKVKGTTHKSLVDSDVMRLTRGKSGKLTVKVSKSLRRKLVEYQGQGGKVTFRAQVVANAVGGRKTTRTFTIKLK